LHVEIVFLIHATARDVEVPRASNGRAAEDLDADGNEDIGDLEGANGVGQASEDAIGIDAQIEEEDGELDEEGAEVVGCEGAEIDLQEYYYVVSGEVPEVDAITIGNCWIVISGRYWFLGKGTYKLAPMQRIPMRKSFGFGSVVISVRGRKKYQGNDEEHFGRTSVGTFKS
jgi:hypothetical protein